MRGPSQWRRFAGPVALVISLVAFILVVLMWAGVTPGDLFGKESAARCGRDLPGFYIPSEDPECQRNAATLDSFVQQGHGHLSIPWASIYWLLAQRRDRLDFHQEFLSDQAIND